MISAVFILASQCRYGHVDRGARGPRCHVAVVRIAPPLRAEQRRQQRGSGSVAHRRAGPRCELRRGLGAGSPLRGSFLSTAIHVRGRALRAFASPHSRGRPGGGDEAATAVILWVRRAPAGPPDRNGRPGGLWEAYDGNIISPLRRVGPTRNLLYPVRNPRRDAKSNRSAAGHRQSASENERSRKIEWRCSPNPRPRSPCR